MGGVPLAAQVGAPHVARPRGWVAGARAPAARARRAAWPRGLVAASLSPWMTALATSLGLEAGRRGRGRQAAGGRRAAWPRGLVAASLSPWRMALACGVGTARCLVSWPRGGVPLAVEEESVPRRRAAVANEG